MNNLARSWQRLVAYFIDLAIKVIIPAVVLWRMSLSVDPETVINSFIVAVAVIFFIYPIVYALINSYLISSFGGNFGKLFMGLRIVLPSGENVGFWRAFFRQYIGYLVSGMLMGLGFIWIIVDKDGRGWHDQMADTYVVVVNKVMSYVGLFLLLAVISFNIVIFFAAWKNFVMNSTVYSQIFTSIISSFDPSTLN